MKNVQNILSVYEFTHNIFMGVFFLYDVSLTRKMQKTKFAALFYHLRDLQHTNFWRLVLLSIPVEQNSAILE